MPITSFRGRYGFLSNYWEAPVNMDGVVYPSVENAYQAAKTLDDAARVPFQTMTSAKSKQAGKKLAMRPDWDTVKFEVMDHLVHQKFTEHKDLRDRLLATGDEPIVEGNHWHDNIWGSCTCDRCGDVGANHLGKLLMKIRDELRGGETPMKTIAIIGTRFAHMKGNTFVPGLSPADYDLITRMAFWLVRNGRRVVTGGAEGVDQAAMLGASLGAAANGLDLKDVLTIYLPWKDYNAELLPAGARIVVGGWDEEDYRLGRLHPAFDRVKSIQKLMLRNAQIIRAADSVTALPRLDAQGMVTGGTAHGVSCANNLKKPLILLTDPVKRVQVVNLISK